MLLSDIAVAGLVLVSAASSLSLGQTDEVNCIFFCASLARQRGGWNTRAWSSLHNCKTTRHLHNKPLVLFLQY